MRFPSGKDALLHAILIGIIVGLSGFLIYFVSLYYSVDDSFRNTFLSGLQIFNPEFAIQDTSPKEIPEPGALHVPILIYYSVRPHLLFETDLLKRYTVSPAAFEKQLQYLKDNNYISPKLTTPQYSGKKSPEAKKSWIAI